MNLRRQGRWRRGLAVVCVMIGGCVSTAETDSLSPQAQTRLQLGLAYLERGRFDVAHSNLLSALKAAPDDYRTQLGMALYEQQIGENAAAEKRYQQLLRQSPSNGSVMNNYGAFLCGLGQYVMAQQQFSRAALLPDHPQVADALENAGYCFLDAGRSDEAKQRLHRALNYDPRKGRRLLAEAEHRMHTGHTEQTRVLLTIYQPKFPASAESLWLQIRFAALAGDTDDAKRYGAMLARSFPQSKQYQQFLANEY
ncbi:type IV pilus biogenesis/stability protein PilW [Lonsdalea populi]|uniref:type IV pilus biogenesis/stability protein PilW n=1 Tax=Lonsdalea populi TaxID=1172565 RepID=UPI000A1D5E8E|nr:type IV pilus biogenesis/stability protein PilW [Lonsdalea populi]OSM97982.1 type IV pilus biogenesis/stability protein PilW [Lonsdalea populi]QPQ23338.1 type IV pilus biogenesis/stability protein PilW [Lonsdalea populi]RAT45544.1 type IV pilus biogenesis/stability protein PilW [Lonsdalea populi]RAT55924.1 type IV pilus biogenesis/stability protein PilW [Lonsdalea populi]RAT60958.1 type IV pilus biogenesis/stability protein PilW [Lonsdalea populi]